MRKSALSAPGGDLGADAAIGAGDFTAFDSWPAARRRRAKILIYQIFVSTFKSCIASMARVRVANTGMIGDQMR